MDELPQNKKIILFDGVCNLCDSAVQYIIKHDKKDIFRFVTLQSELGKKIVSYIGLESNNIDSIILYHPKIAYYYKSAAVLEICSELGGYHYIINSVKIFPLKAQDFFYDYIAKNRYKWYGKKMVCMIPTAEIQLKFL